MDGLLDGCVSVLVCVGVWICVCVWIFLSLDENVYPHCLFFYGLKQLQYDLGINFAPVGAQNRCFIVKGKK